MLSLRRELGSKGQPIRHAANEGKKTREGGWEKQTNKRTAQPSRRADRNLIPHCPAIQTADRRNLNLNLGGCESPALIHPRTNPQRLSQLRNNGDRSLPNTKQSHEPPSGERLQDTQQEQP